VIFFCQVVFATLKFLRRRWAWYQSRPSYQGTWIKIKWNPYIRQFYIFAALQKLGLLTNGELILTCVIIFIALAIKRRLSLLSLYHRVTGREVRKWKITLAQVCFPIPIFSLFYFSHLWRAIPNLVVAWNPILPVQTVAKSAIIAALLLWSALKLQ